MIARPIRVCEAQQKFFVGECSILSQVTTAARYTNTGTSAARTEPAGPAASMLMSST